MKVNPWRCFNFIIIIFILTSCIIYFHLHNDKSENSTSNHEIDNIIALNPLLHSASNVCMNAIRSELSSYLPWLHSPPTLPNSCPFYYNIHLNELSSNDLQCVYHCRHVGAYCALKNESNFCHCVPTQSNASCWKTGVTQPSKNIPIYNVMDFDPLANPSKASSGLSIAFLLTLNGRDVMHIQQLINSIYDDKHIYIIHVDSRNSFLFHTLHDIYQDYANIYFASDRRASIWGGSSLLQVILDGMRLALTLTDVQPWSYFINLSESDLLIKPLFQLEEFLAANVPFNFLKRSGQDMSQFIYKQALQQLFVECEQHLWRVCERRLPNNIVMDGGSDWVVLHKRFVRFVVLSPSELVVSLKRYYLMALLPAESFFHTVLANSEFCTDLMDTNLRLTNWQRALGCQCDRYSRIVDWCGCSPNVFRYPQHWTQLQHAAWKPIFFARKFEMFGGASMMTRVRQILKTDKTMNTSHHFLNLYDSRYDLNVVHHSPALLALHYSAVLYATQACAHSTALFQNLHLHILHYNISVPELDAVLDPGFASQNSLIVTLQDAVTLSGKSNVNNAIARLRVRFSQKGIVQDALSRNSHDNGQQWALRRIKVNSHYDPKEMLFRNYLEVIVLEPQSVEVVNIQMVWQIPSDAASLSNVLNVDLSIRCSPSRNFDLLYQYKLRFTDPYLLVLKDSDYSSLAVQYLPLPWDRLSPGECTMLATVVDQLSHSFSISTTFFVLSNQINATAANTGILNAIWSPTAVCCQWEPSHLTNKDLQLCALAL